MGNQHKHRYNYTLTTWLIRVISLVVIQLSLLQAVLVRRSK